MSVYERLRHSTFEDERSPSSCVCLFPLLALSLPPSLSLSLSLSVYPLQQLLSPNEHVVAFDARGGVTRILRRLLEREREKTRCQLADVLPRIETDTINAKNTEILATLEANKGLQRR